MSDALKEVAGVLDPVQKALANLEIRTNAAAQATETLYNANRSFVEALFNRTDLKEAFTNFSESIAQGFTTQFLDFAMTPVKEQIFGQMKKLFGVESAQEKAQKALLDAGKGFQSAVARFDMAVDKYAAGPASSQSLGSSLSNGLSEYEYMDKLSTRGPAYVQEIEGMLEQEFAGIGASLTDLGTVAETTSKQTGNAAATGEKGFGKFLGAMTGVATGALAITGAIQAMQDSKGGTYETLMGIAGVLGGLGSIFGGISSLGTRAAGGPVNANRPYVVGEIGPELFVPSSNGTIVPNNRLSGNPYAASSDYLGQMGASNRALRNDPIRVDTRVINGVEYATADQLREATTLAERRGAERGRSLALGSLQNSVRARKQVGLA